MSENQIGLVGLAVMGQNLALNIARNGFGISVYNRTRSITDEFMNRAGSAAGITAVHGYGELADSLARPRKVICMVKAGHAVDAVIQPLLGVLEEGDLIIDGGNSLFTDTRRRQALLEKKGLKFMGVGISGGEEGALHGPSIMPGGDPESWEMVKPVLEAIAAKASGDPCVGYMGQGGGGHFVKMVHNGIEYADMQLIAESYELLRKVLGLPAAQIADVFAQWRNGPLSSYLIDITADIFRKTDDDTGNPLVDMILDAAGQKGTGRWTSQQALELGVSVPTITSAVDARTVSAMKNERIKAENILPGPDSMPAAPDPEEFVEWLGNALYMAKICSYAQGFALLKAADREYGFGLSLGTVAKVWRAGCIIRADFLDDVSKAFTSNPDLPNLLMDPFFANEAGSRQAAIRQVAAVSARAGAAVPAFYSALAYFDAYRTGLSPANLIQAQRDYFGAHTFQRTDKEGVFHVHWT